MTFLNKSALPKLVHPILTSVGILSVVLGIIGIFLPLMPTTPYVVTLVVLATSSQRLRMPAADGLPYRRGEAH